MTAEHSEAGYATLLDALLFLVLVSIGAALVAQTLPGSAGLEAARELRSQRLDGAALDSLLAHRGSDGRTLGERLGEALLERMAGDGSLDTGLERGVGDTLAHALGPRERFNLTVVWRPVPWTAVGARISVGPPAPAGAASVERDLVLPTGERFNGTLAGGSAGAATPAALLDAVSRSVLVLLPAPGSEDPALRALAEEALGERLRSGGNAADWLAEQLRPNRARAVLALWRA